MVRLCSVQGFPLQITNAVAFLSSVLQTQEHWTSLKTKQNKQKRKDQFSIPTTEKIATNMFTISFCFCSDITTTNNHKVPHNMMIQGPWPEKWKADPPQANHGLIHLCNQTVSLLCLLGWRSGWFWVGCWLYHSDCITVTISCDFRLYWILWSVFDSDIIQVFPLTLQRSDSALVFSKTWRKNSFGEIIDMYQ